MADAMDELLDFLQVPLLLDARDEGLTAFVTVHALVFARLLVHPRGLVEHLDEGEAVFLRKQEVIRVMGGSAFHRAGAELDVDVGVGHEGDGLAIGGVDDVVPDVFGVARVLGVDEDGGVAEHRLGAGRCDDDLLGGPFDVVEEIEELAFVVAMEDLDVA